MIKTKILFVDDEEDVLTGLRRMLYSLGGAWEMTFVRSGDEALERMAKNEQDIVVADLHMPGMGGGELLRRLREQYPGTVRIALTGHADKRTLIEAAAPIHQFLAKPCKPESLKATIVRAVELGELLSDADLKRLVAEMSTLPGLPGLVCQFSLSLI